MADDSHGQYLGDYAWSHRLVLVFAPDDDERRQHALPQEDLVDGVKDRDLLIWFVGPEAISPWAENSDMALADEPAELRERFNIGPDDFTVILLGKDGTEKERWYEPPGWRRSIFPLIDSMPMRQREMTTSD